MADYQAVPTGSSTQDSSRQPPVTATLVVYALFALAAHRRHRRSRHARRRAAADDHRRHRRHRRLHHAQRCARHVGGVAPVWLIRTFWWSLLWNCLGWVLAVTLIGLPVALAIWVATTIWVIYRVIRGYLLSTTASLSPACEGSGSWRHADRAWTSAAISVAAPGPTSRRAGTPIGRDSRAPAPRAQRCGR